MPQNYACSLNAQRKIVSLEIMHCFFGGKKSHRIKPVFKTLKERTAHLRGEQFFGQKLMGTNLLNNI